MFFATNMLCAQTFSTTAKLVSTIGTDSVYWFSDWTDATICASAATENAVVEWYAFDEATTDFSTLLQSDMGTSSCFKAEQTGGFLCKITTDSGTDQYRFWADVPTIDSLFFSIDTISCDEMQVVAEPYAPATRVYNFASAEWQEIAQKLVYNWYVADTLQLTTNSRESSLEPPMDNAELKLVVYNQIDNSKQATDSVESYGVKALFTYAEREREVENEITTGGVYSAPAEIEFKSNSKGNITVYEWVMGDVSRLYEKNPVYSFQTTGTYNVKLIVTDETTGCSSVDSTLELTITDAFMGFPQVFTPNGDGVNDEFRAAYKSLKHFDLKIYNRWGRRVYHSTDPSKGWNGKEGNAEAAEGVYMYVAEAEGFDKGVKIRRHGSVTLVR